jgi:hypothetical protein
MEAPGITVRSPQANAFAERFAGALRRECLDQELILGEEHLRKVLAEYARHYDSHRPHQGLQREPPAPARPRRRYHRPDRAREPRRRPNRRVPQSSSLAGGKFQVNGRERILGDVHFAGAHLFV